MNQIMKVEQVNSPQRSVAEDEISLIDLFLVLYRRRRLIATIVLVITLLGVITALIMPSKYQYSATIDIGRIVSMSEKGLVFEYIDQPDTVLAKLKEGYIPLVLGKYLVESGEESGYEISARKPKGSNMIVLESKAGESDQEVVSELLSEVIELLVVEHRRLMDIVRGQLNLELEQARIGMAALVAPSTLAAKEKAVNTRLAVATLELGALKDQRIQAVPRRVLENKLQSAEAKLQNLLDRERLLFAQQKRLNEMEGLLKKQVGELEASLKESVQRRHQAVSEAKDEAAAMTLLLLDNEIQQNRNRLGQLEERLHVKLQNQREELENQILENKRQRELQDKVIRTGNDELVKFDLDNQHKQGTVQPQVSKLEEDMVKLRADHAREIQQQKAVLVEMESRLDNLVETRALVAPMRSPNKVGVGKKVVVIVALLLGLFSAIFFAFLLEFIGKARQQMLVTDQGVN